MTRAREKFDRFMVANANGHNLKLARFTDSEFRALIQGVLPIASMCEVRGAFMVGDTPATAEDVVFLAPKVSRRTADAAIKKMRQLGMLEHDDELGGEWVHDWDKLNPAPKKDTTNAERQARFRTRNGGSNGQSNGDVTPQSEANNADSLRASAIAGARSPEGKEVEGEGEEEENSNVEPARLDHAAATRDLFAYWQERCDHTQAKLTADRKTKIAARLREGYSPDQIRLAIDGAARAAYVNDAGKRFDDIELICRTGSKLEDFITRATATNVDAAVMAGQTEAAKWAARAEEWREEAGA